MYNTYPGSRLLFPSLCRPTAPVGAVDTQRAQPARTLAMPRRTTTRADNRMRAVMEERRQNEILFAQQITERDKPPPF